MVSSNNQHFGRSAIFLSLVFLFLFLHGNRCLFAFRGSQLVISWKSKEHDGNSMIHRKVLSAEFDFTPFLHRHMPEPDPSSKEVDPIYGEEKRPVPSGPNPLHH
ncbi:hypothetical protein SAY87_003085 [Trapa incisa]|uniref:Uncharacterized protein n=1 Tax=Trapa incisa TaxID=236973 RepID=A0AAN7QHK7_9MYRT|nr:hypothetical protein SAY87_003085 [Trapa incisa]